MEFSGGVQYKVLSGGRVMVNVRLKSSHYRGLRKLNVSRGKDKLSALHHFHALMEPRSGTLYIHVKQ